MNNENINKEQPTNFMAVPNISVPYNTPLPSAPQPITINININNDRREASTHDRSDDDETQMFVLRDEIAVMATEMQKKLNASKEGWNGVPVVELINRLQDSVGQLKAAIELKLSPETVVEQAADVANRVMMVADNYLKEREDGD